MINGNDKASLELLTKISFELDLPIDYFVTGSRYSNKSYLTNCELVPLVERMDSYHLSAYIEIGKIQVRQQEEEEKRRKELEDSFYKA